MNPFVYIVLTLACYLVPYLAIVATVKALLTLRRKPSFAYSHSGY